MVRGRFFLFFCVLLNLTYASAANAQIFQWPVSPSNPDNPAKLGQDYAQFNGFPKRKNHYHTGLDIGAPRGTKVYAAAKGYIEAVCPNIPGGCVFNGKTFAASYTSDNHGLQGVIILRHTLPDGTVYSLYAHLGGDDSDSGIADGVVTGFAANQEVQAGTLLGITNENNHVHFEMKDAAVLHNPSEHPGSCIDPISRKLSPRCWGYTLDPPSQQGYRDPILFLHPFAHILDRGW